MIEKNKIKYVTTSDLFEFTADDFILAIVEFLDNINQVDEEQFNEIQKTFYLKMIAEINFIKIYLYFKFTQD